MTAPDENVSILEIYTEPLAVLQLTTPGPPGRPGDSGDPGPPGPPGVRFTDAFDPSRVYLPGDLVTYNGVLYISSGTSVEGIAPPDPLYWTPISYDGDTPLSPPFMSDVPAGMAVGITHGLNTELVSVTLRDKVTKEVVYPGVHIVDNNNIELTFGYDSINPVDGTFHVTVKSDV